MSKRKAWRCFHCDDFFTNERDAGLHFGNRDGQTPACVIKSGGEGSLVKALREAENEVEYWMMAVHNENTESAKAYYAQQSRHRTQMEAVEVTSFEKGIREVNEIVGGALVKLTKLYEEEYDNPERPDWLKEAMLLCEARNAK